MEREERKWNLIILKGKKRRKVRRGSRSEKRRKKKGKRKKGKKEKRKKGKTLLSTSPARPVRNNQPRKTQL